MEKQNAPPSPDAPLWKYIRNFVLICTAILLIFQFIFWLTEKTMQADASNPALHSILENLETGDYQLAIRMVDSSGIYLECAELSDVDPAFTQKATFPGQEVELLLTPRSIKLTHCNSSDTCLVKELWEGTTRLFLNDGRVIQFRLKDVYKTDRYRRLDSLFCN